MEAHSQTPKLWDIKEEVHHSDCLIFSVYRRRCRHPVRQIEDDFYMLKFTDWAMNLSLTAEGEIILVNQYRFGKHGLSWEVPGGTLDTDEDVIQGATRELLEETGYAGKNARLIGSCSPNPALQDNQAHFVLTENCTFQQAPSWDPHEEMEIHRVPLEEAYEMAFSGKIHHALSISALFFLKEYLRKNRS